MSLAIAFGTDLPVSVQTPGNEQSTISFEVKDSTSLTWVISITVIAGLILFSLFVRSPAVLRDSRGGPYSLGRTQLAFWTLIISGCWVAIFFITGNLERLPAQVLVLIGISGATGMAAKVIGDSKTAKLQEERNQLAVAAELAKAAGAVAGTTKFDLMGGSDRLAAVEGALSPPAQPRRNFIVDICSDTDGTSIYRAQVVLWTLILGGVFVWTVAQVVAMPEFPAALLTLLGISNSTYLGMKVPESK